MKLRIAVFAALFTAAATLAIAFSDDIFQGNVAKKPFDPALQGKAAKTSGTQILYHGGPVMNQSTTVYVIYYGTFPSTTQPIINDYMTGLSGSPAYGVNHSYNDPTAAGPAPVAFTYTFTPPAPAPTTNPSGTVYLDSGSQGAQLSNSSIPKIVTHAIQAGLGANQNGVYLVITAPNIKVSGFCTSFCAYHNTSTAISNGLHIRYALVPDPTQRCTGCNGGIAVYKDTATPNGDMGADTLTDDIMHELSETVTDPDINAWYTQGGAENGDLCNYVYETPASPIQIGHDPITNAVYHYNVHLNNRDFLIQLIWKNSGVGACAAQ